MAWNFFNNTGSVKSSTINNYSSNVIASNSTIAIVNNSVNLVTGTTRITTATGGRNGGKITIFASGQSTGSCLILNHGTAKDNFYLKSNPMVFSNTVSSPTALGLYNGESVTFQHNGSYWVETNRNLKTLLEYAISSAAPGNTVISATTEATANTLSPSLSTNWQFDGSTSIEITFSSPRFSLPPNGTTPTKLTTVLQDTDGNASLSIKGQVAYDGITPVEGSGGHSFSPYYYFRLVPNAYDGTASTTHKYSFASYRTNNNVNVYGQGTAMGPSSAAAGYSYMALKRSF